MEKINVPLFMQEYQAKRKQEEQEELRKQEELKKINDAYNKGMVHGGLFTIISILVLLFIHIIEII